MEFNAAHLNIYFKYTVFKRLYPKRLKFQLYKSEYGLYLLAAGTVDCRPLVWLGLFITNKIKL